MSLAGPQDGPRNEAVRRSRRPSNTAPYGLRGPSVLPASFSKTY